MKRLLAMALALVMVLAMTACGGEEEKTVKSGVEDGVLTVGMECAYAPYNWAQTDDSNGAVKISNFDGYANGYDVMMAKKLCEANGWELEIKMLEWDSLVPAVMSGEIDCAIAGQSMTAEREKQVDFAGPYLYASIVVLTKADSELASATGISQLTGKCTSQSGTVWYDVCLPQIEGASIESAQKDAPNMLLALETGAVEFVCTDMPTAQGAVVVYPDMTILDFSGTEDNFEVSDEEINIGISVMEGNTVLKDAMNKILKDMTAADFNAIMEQAVAIQPIEE
ncbi:MAG: transporter substrate-binding domain-containing protein [Ruminococcaceae bacterium]|nr:transporter substrate-binding domain-containing protein [Oscillospiraceae bacterium]